MPAEDDDERHKREEAERRAKRKAAKMSKSDSLLEKQRRQKEHRDRVLKQHGGAAASSSSQKKTEPKFQDLFQQRAQGFQIDFRFRNAPPRPPVGPTFVGNSLDTVLNDLCKRYKPLNAVEVNYTWKLHSEPDLGVPLAPSAIDIKCYDKEVAEKTEFSVHPDDQALLEWTGSMGDTAADKLKRKQEKARAEARMLASGRDVESESKPRPNKKVFSRVLNEGMQTWMKKTTYLSNDYSRKVHDFKSLAKSKEELAQDLQIKQEEIAKRRSARAIEQSFSDAPLQHPTKKTLKPKSVYQVLPDVEHWGRAYTQLVIDKAPALKHPMEKLNQAILGDVEKKKANSRMNACVYVPVDEADEDGDRYEAAQSFDLDVVPLKEEDSPPTHFCIWVDEESGVASYLPIASRVQLSTGRPVPNGGIRMVRRRPLSSKEQEAVEERMAEIDEDMAEKHHIDREDTRKAAAEPMDVDTPAAANKSKDSDGEDDFGDDDSSDSGDEMLFGKPAKTIVAEG